MGDNMMKYDVMNELMEEHNGYLFTKDVEAAGISRPYLASFVKDRKLEKVAKGIYISPDTWEDELYILQLRYPKIVYSGETALYLHGLIDREYSEVMVCVPPKYNRTRLCAEGVLVHQENETNYMMGVVELQTNFGNVVRAYDLEKCVCETVKARGKIDVQHFQTAMKTYMRSKERNLDRLMKYAELLRVYDEIMKYVEVMV